MGAARRCLSPESNDYYIAAEELPALEALRLGCGAGWRRWLAPARLPAMSGKDDDCVKVVVRCRPMNRKEIEDGRERVVDMNLKTNQVQVRNPKQAGDASKPFTFDKIYDWNSMQEPVFEETARPWKSI